MGLTRMLRLAEWARPVAQEVWATFATLGTMSMYQSLHCRNPHSQSGAKTRLTLCGMLGLVLMRLSSGRQALNADGPMAEQEADTFWS